MNWRRVLYAVFGLVIVVESIATRDWLFAAVGGYFAAMGIFGFGCAGGACGVPFAKKETMQKEEISFEEIK